MSVESYLTDGEIVNEQCTINNWTWVITDKRILKYRDGGGTKEEMHDISIDEISSIRVVRTERDEENLIASGVLGIGAGVIRVAGASLPILNSGNAMILAGLCLILAIVLFLAWLSSDEGEIELKGDGILAESNGAWTAKIPSEENYEKIELIVKAVRESQNTI